MTSAQGVLQRRLFQFVATILFFFARCREKGKGTDDCVKNPNTSDCKICNAFSEEQRLQLATPSYRIKKEKREAKKLEATPSKDNENLIDPASVSVIGPVEKSIPTL